MTQRYFNKEKYKELMTFKSDEFEIQTLQRILKEREPIFNQYLANGNIISDIFTYLKILDAKYKSTLDNYTQ